MKQHISWHISHRTDTFEPIKFQQFFCISILLFLSRDQIVRFAAIQVCHFECTTVRALFFLLLRNKFSFRYQNLWMEDNMAFVRLDDMASIQR